MARTQSQILDELTRNAPAWLRKWPVFVPVLRAAARALAYVETSIDSLREQSFRQTADGAHLTDIGDEHGIARLPGEDDDDYRARITLRAQGVTPAALRTELDYIVEHYLGDGFDVRLFEPTQVFANDSFFADDVESITLPPADERPRDLFWLAFPAFPKTDNSGTAFANLAFADDSFAGDDTRDPAHRLIHSTLLDWVDTHRLAGVAFGVTVKDTVQPNTLDLLFTEEGAGFIATT